MLYDFTKKFGEAISFLESSDISSPNKPVIPHALRVGKYLFEKGMDNQIVNAGLLHDMLEWSSVVESEVEEKFGKRVLELIKANTKDRNIEDKNKRMIDKIERCKQVGDDALAIKIADTLDSFYYYSEIKSEEEIDRCRRWTKLLIDNLSVNSQKVFLQELNEMIK